MKPCLLKKVLIDYFLSLFQALQQSMLHGGLPAMHQLHDRPTQPSGGEIPHQQMGMVGGDGFYHSTPDGLFVPNLQHVVAQQSPRQQSGGKPRSQAIPIIPPKVKACGVKGH